MIIGLLGRIASVALLLGLAAAQARAQGDVERGAVMVMESTLADHTVYHPRSLVGFGHARPLPLVVWGNGGCSKRGNSAEPFLEAVAAHGYLVIANGVVRPGPLGPPPGPPPGSGAGAAGAGPPRVPPSPSEMTRTAQLAEAIEWAKLQNSDPKSPYFKKLAPEAVAAMGTSCGGLQAIEMGPDPRVTTVATFSSGLLDEPRPGANATHESLQRLHGPILYVVGGPADGAAPHAIKDFGMIDAVPVVLAQNAPASHGSPLIEPQGGAWAPVAEAWLDWRLKSDPRGAAMFTGPDCVLCKRPEWSVQSKGF